MFFRKNIPIPLGGASFVEFDIFAFSANDAAAILRSKYFAIAKTHWVSMPKYTDLCVAKRSLKYQNCSIKKNGRSFPLLSCQTPLENPENCTSKPGKA